MVVFIFARKFVKMSHCGHAIDWYSDERRFFVNGCGDKLFDPACSVCDKAMTGGRIESFGRANQSHVSFIDEIHRRKAVMSVFSGEDGNKSEVRCHKSISCTFVSTVRLNRDLNFFFAGQKRYLAYLLHIRVENGIAGRGGLKIANGGGCFARLFLCGSHEDIYTPQQRSRQWAQGATAGIRGLQRVFLVFHHSEYTVENLIGMNESETPPVLIHHNKLCNASDIHGVHRVAKR